MSEAEELFRHLREVAAKVGIDVYIGALKGRGGICKVKEKWIIVLNRDNSLDENLDCICRYLSNFDLETVYILPAAREKITHYMESRFTAAQETTPPVSLDHRITD